MSNKFQYIFFVITSYEIIIRSDVTFDNKQIHWNNKQVEFD